MEPTPTPAGIRRRLYRALPIALFAVLSYGLASLLAPYNDIEAKKLTIVLMVFVSAAYFAGLAIGRATKAT
jgi:hypothetical protein